MRLSLLGFPSFLWGSALKHHQFFATQRSNQNRHVPQWAPSLAMLLSTDYIYVAPWLVHSPAHIFMSWFDCFVPTTGVWSCPLTDVWNIQSLVLNTYKLLPRILRKVSVCGSCCWAVHCLLRACWTCMSCSSSHSPNDERIARITMQWGIIKCCCVFVRTFLSNSSIASIAHRAWVTTLNQWQAYFNSFYSGSCSPSCTLSLSLHFVHF